MRNSPAARYKVEVSSGNVFADLLITHADIRQTEVQLAVAIQREIATRDWSQTQAATALGINQPKVSALLKFQLQGFSVERLMTFLTALGNDIEISIKPRRAGQRRAGKIVVGIAA